MTTGIAQLREERYRFTVETQGIAYSTKQLRSAVLHDEDTVWSDDDGDDAAP
jgi:hypothetical protein